MGQTSKIIIGMAGVVLIFAVFFAIVSYRHSRRVYGCKGAADCKVCRACTHCWHCAVNGGTCGVNRPTTKPR
jgi:hypothetical protein